MDQHQFGHEFERLPKFEGSVVSSINRDGTPNLNSYNRSDDRTEVGLASSLTPLPGDRLLTVAGGDNEIPKAIGWDPWITQ